MDDEQFHQLIEHLIEEGSEYVHGKRTREQHRLIESLAIRVRQAINDRRFDAACRHYHEQERLREERYGMLMRGYALPPSRVE